jgi:hypothetical protein
MTRVSKGLSECSKAVASIQAASCPTDGPVAHCVTNSRIESRISVGKDSKVAIVGTGRVQVSIGACSSTEWNWEDKPFPEYTYLMQVFLPITELKWLQVWFFCLDAFSPISKPFATPGIVAISSTCTFLTSIGSAETYPVYFEIVVEFKMSNHLRFAFCRKVLPATESKIHDYV